MNRRELLALAAGAALGTFSPFDNSLEIFAADTSANALITLTRNDGKVLKGKIMAYDRDKVTMDVIAKPKDPPVSTNIPWGEIKHISSGLTRESAVQKWKGEHHDSLCQTCHGDGKTFCPTCHGTAHDPAASKDCPTCKGAAQIPCKTPKCDHGTIPCPNPKCLKLSDGGWFTKPDGNKWKRFQDKDGVMEISEGHVGQVIDRVDGRSQMVGTCPVCGGITTISDPVCRGTGEMPCPTCSKKTKSPPCPAKCDAGTVVCPTCKGTGLKS